MTLYTKYNQLLLKKPLFTNMVTTGILFGTGDYLAQSFFTSSHTNKPKPYDYSRTLRAMIYGSIIFAPIGDKWYKLINKVKFPIKVFDNKSRTMLLDTITRVAGDQLIFAPFIGIPMYYTVMTFMEFKPNPMSAIQNKLETNLWHTLTTNWLVWPIFQLLNFGLIPVQFRLLLVNIISIGWNCYLSYVLNDTKDHGHLIEDINPDDILV